MVDRDTVELWDDEEVWFSAFGRAPNGVCMLDAMTGTLLRSNQEMERILERSTDELVAMTCMEMAHPEDRARLQAAYARLLGGEDPVSVEGRLRTGSGTYRWGLGTMSLIRDAEGNPKYCDSRLVDITPLKESETAAHAARVAAEEAAESREAFLASMSHELGTPLNAVIGLSSILARGTYGELTERQRDAVDKVEASGRRLLTLINDVLDFAKLRAVEPEPELREFAVADLVEGAVAQVRESAMARAVTLSSQPVTGVTIVADERRLRQALVHLLGNAVKFSPEGSSVEVGWSASDAGLDLWVADRGPGIDPAEFERLVEPIAQADRGLDRAQEGTGLGLSLCREIVTLHGGRLYTRPDDRGGRVGFFIPSVAAARADQPSDGPIEGSGSDVLVVEDNDVNRLLIVDYLKSVGFEVRTANDGIEALEAIDVRIPDLVLMDVQMPRLDGLAATREIRANPRSRTVPVVALTAMAVKGDAERCLEAGCDAYLAKPVDLPQLTEVVRVHMRRPAEEPIHDL